MTEDITEWVKQRLLAGEDPNTLKERLSAYGYDSIIVDQITSPSPSTSPKNKEGVNKFKQNKFVIVGVIILIIIGILSLNFINSISDFNRNRNLESNQALFDEQLYNEAKGLDELTIFVKDSVAMCRESKNYMFFGHHKDECYESVLIFYMNEFEQLSEKGNISEEETKKAFSEAGNYVLKEICPYLEDKKKRGDCEAINPN